MFEDVDEGHPDGEENVVFRYNREERLEKAPQIVKDYYAGKMEPVRGIKVLWANKSNRFILISLIFFVGAAYLYTGLNRTRGWAKIDDISFELEAFSYEDEIYTSLKINNKKADEKSLPVTINTDFSLVNADNQIMDRFSQTTVYISGEEYVRTKKTDYDIIRVDVVVSAGDKQKELSAQVRRQ